MITNSLDVTKYNVDLLLVLDIVRMRRAMLTCILPTVFLQYTRIYNYGCGTKRTLTAHNKSLKPECSQRLDVQDT